MDMFVVMLNRLLAPFLTGGLVAMFFASTEISVKLAVLFGAIICGLASLPVAERLLRRITGAPG